MKGNWFSTLGSGSVSFCACGQFEISLESQTRNKAKHEIARSVGGCDSFVHGHGATVAELENMPS